MDSEVRQECMLNNVSYVDDYVAICALISQYSLVALYLLYIANQQFAQSWGVKSCYHTLTLSCPNFICLQWLGCERMRAEQNLQCAVRIAVFSRRIIFADFED